MSLSLASFRTAYRALLAELIALAGGRFDVSVYFYLLESPLSVSHKARGSVLQRMSGQLADIEQSIDPATRDTYEQEARAVIEEVKKEHSPINRSFGAPAGGAGAAHMPSGTPSQGAGSGGGAIRRPGTDRNIELAIELARAGTRSVQRDDRRVLGDVDDAAGAGEGIPATSDDIAGTAVGGPQRAPSEPPRPSASIGATPPPPPPEPLPPEVRYLNASILDHDKGAPLEPETEYVLSVSVDLKKTGDGGARFPDVKLTHEEDEAFVELTIQVAGEGFAVAQDSLPLKLPRRGPSQGKARFDIRTMQAGEGKLSISVSKKGNFVLEMELTYVIGESARAKEPMTRVNGRSMGAADKIMERALGLTIKPVLGGYDCSVRGYTYTSVTLPITEAALGDAVKAARDAMLKVVAQLDANNNAVFQNGVHIDPASEALALRTLARAGAALFRALFYGPSAGPEVRKIGDLIRRMTTNPERQLTIQIVADRFPVPWGLLYMGSDSDDDEIEWEKFLGMRHVIEQIPLQTDMLVDDYVIPSDKPGLAVSVNVNTSIDEKWHTDIVARQVEYWAGCAAAPATRVTVARRETGDDFRKALHQRAGDQLMYLYCHAVTKTPKDAGGIQGSSFIFSGGQRLSLEVLNREAPTTDVLPGNPLVFINACESAELRPEFYDGFVPYFMAKGARGVVGTECETPGMFGAEWALAFFPRFLGGEPLGAVFLGLRREFMEQHHNPLGLLYNVYCDADTKIQPALTF